MNSILEGACLVDWDQALMRNIVSLEVSEDLFDDLSGDPADQEAAIAHEMAIKPPFYSDRPAIIHRPFEESEWFASIDYPFHHWARTRYSDGAFGVWYGAPNASTTVYETVYHWMRFLADAEGYDRPPATIERKVYEVHCRALLIDLRPLVGKHPELVHPDDYQFTQQIGHRLHAQGPPGLLSRSARCDGDIAAVLTPDVLSKPSFRFGLSYDWDGECVRVRRGEEAEWMVLRDPLGRH
ncbi:RES domain protein (plasmid) [Thioalkalivibrio sp. K90mix]|uniref:RES family NAD+ phosphorylase n=1 Tax=Thioalkalivibrio sp. (strain K90mix) TaxID=396595 RepID=UPI000195A4D2|nr:RES family NAD+ phosphorylase [Thioalkalivibrio sp. K90mix]ADC73201.1 RES domain protein [Thioalkalivibrio sp. K90mix]